MEASRRNHHDQLDLRATVPGSGPRDGHDVLERPLQHHGSPLEARGRGPHADAGTRGELGRRREDRDVQPARRRQAGRTATRSPRRTSSSPGSARSHRNSPQTTRTSSTGIVGADDYNSCKKNCDAMRDKVGVEAVDDRTLRVELTSSSRGSSSRSRTTRSCPSTGPPSSTSATAGRRPSNIVTNGPFQLARWDHNSRIDLVKWNEWRNADEVSLKRVNGRMITEGTTAVQAFEAGEVDETGALGGLPPEEMPRLKEHARVRADSVTRDLLLRRQRRQHPRREPAARDGTRHRSARRSSTTSRRPTSCPRPASRRAACPASTRSLRTPSFCRRPQTSIGRRS